MSEHWNRLVVEWAEAGVIDADTAHRIRAFEAARSGAARWRWPMWLALAFGGLMLASGVLLFVAAHWDSLSPTARFTLVLAVTGLFHVGGAFAADRHPAVASTLHAVGTVAVGGGIFLAGQIFHLAEHWPGGILLWMAGALLAWLVLRDWPQLLLVSLLVPTWLTSEWIVASARWPLQSAQPIGAGLLLLALAYLTAVVPGRASIERRALRAVGRLALLPTALTLALAPLASRSSSVPIDRILPMVAWTVAMAAPLLLAAWLRGRATWLNAAAAAWVAVLLVLQHADLTVAQYAWWAAGAAGLVGWGIHETESDRVNLGSAIFATTVLAFYFSEVMTKLGRSASLISLGLVFLAGGWAFERARRRLVQQAKGASS